MKNYGLKIKERPITAYKFGASPIPFEALQPDGDWHDYLPETEIQNVNGIETYACVVYTILNCVEILIKRKYGIERNYAERFLATVVNTRGVGSDPYEVAEFLRKLGIPPQSVLPFDETVDTEDKFFAPIPPKVYEIAREFLAEFDFRHEGVTPTPENITKALQCSPLLMSVPAWYEKNGLYFRPAPTTPDNHATTLIGQRIGEYRTIFDSYGDAIGDPYIKDVRWDCIPQMVMRFYVNKKVAQKDNWLIALIKSIIASIKPQKNVPDVPVVPIVIPSTPVKSPRERLYEAALTSLDLDASPNDLAPDEYGCAESVNEVYKKAFGEYIENPGISTTKLFAAMVDRADKFIRVTDAEPGNIIISPTGFSSIPNTPIKNGHVGIFGKDKKIMSNSSASGKFTENYTLDTWINRYRKQGGYPCYFFKCIS